MPLSEVIEVNNSINLRTLEKLQWVIRDAPNSYALSAARADLLRNKIMDTLKELNQLMAVQ